MSFKIKASHNFVKRNVTETHPSKTLEQYLTDAKTVAYHKTNKSKTLPRTFSIKTVPRGMEDFY